MEAFLFFSLSAASGACFTSIGCRRAHVQHRRPGWHLILLGAGITLLATMLLIGGGDLFHPARWSDYKGGFWLPVMFPSVCAASVALLSSLAVVYYFRSSFINDKPMV
jgi:hypothetical protein